ncbi:hypothetical protein EVAR_5502_1 [Eumeta japonica]|uniref:Uncharacterized protein n=1 Tax=Eumeta variegata TaxID=151549 RepID=A0A4C1T8T3_EUMVA|nr:hypothetical protein EVAR_5502_1 [Eumeta japonica]
MRSQTRYNVNNSVTHWSNYAVHDPYPYPYHFPVRSRSESKTTLEYEQTVEPELNSIIELRSGLKEITTEKEVDRYKNVLRVDRAARESYY